MDRISLLAHTYALACAWLRQLGDEHLVHGEEHAPIDRRRVALQAADGQASDACDRALQHHVEEWFQQRGHLASACLRARDAARAYALPWLRRASFAAGGAVEVVHRRVRLQSFTYGPQYVCGEVARPSTMAAYCCAVHVGAHLMESMGRADETIPFAQYTLGWVRSVLAEWDSGSMSV